MGAWNQCNASIPASVSPGGAIAFHAQIDTTVRKIKTTRSLFVRSIRQAQISQTPSIISFSRLQGFPPQSDNLRKPESLLLCGSAVLASNQTTRRVEPALLTIHAGGITAIVRRYPAEPPDDPVGQVQWTDLCFDDGFHVTFARSHRVARFSQ
jgi:hypothetical protein